MQSNYGGWQKIYLPGEEERFTTVGQIKNTPQGVCWRLKLNNQDKTLE